jgi:hypothetical protein
MALLKKSAIATPKPPKEAVKIDSLGGEVAVRGLLLRDRLALSVGEDRFAQVGALLAATVIDGDGEPIFSAAEWEAFGASHFDDALRLFAVAQRLSGLSVEDSKKN